MRQCPRCHVEMSSEGRKFAVIDRCSGCGGVFLDAGEGVTALGQRDDISSLVASGAARMVGPSTISCPSGHGVMSLVRFGADDAVVEIDVCTTCQGAFFDAGETDILEEITSRAGEVEITTASGARFSAPPAAGAPVSQESVIDQFRAEKGKSAFATFFSDLASASVAAAGRGVHHTGHRHRRGLVFRR